MHINSIIEYLDNLLEVNRFNDYCPNGLQVHGRDDVKKLVAGVTASMEFLERAHQQGADTVLVHHGYFWKNEIPTIVGLKKKRIDFLLKHEINLIAYHLPLDAHPIYGNNAQLAKVLGFQQQSSLALQPLVSVGSLAQAMSLKQLSQHIQHKLARQPLVIGQENKMIKRIAWCTGAAQGYFADVWDQDIDAYLSGEISENTVHTANESGVAYISAGHHATERYGPMALAQLLAQEFSLPTEFIDIDNPV